MSTDPIDAVDLEDEDGDWDITDSMDAMDTDIFILFGDLNPYSSKTDPHELAVAMDYVIDCIGWETRRGVKQESMWQLSELAYELRGSTLEMPPVPSDNPWIEVKDGDPRLLMVFKDHYTYRQRPENERKNNLVIGPGYKLPLIIPNSTNPLTGRPQAIFAWRLEKYRNDEDFGACCAFFRNESNYLASYLILAAEEHAMLRWPYIPRFFTHIDTTKVSPIMRHGKPTWGYSYMKAGWQLLKKRTMSKGLLRLEKTFMPLGWLDTWEYTHVRPKLWPFPERIVRQRNPTAGGRPRMKKATRQNRTNVQQLEVQLPLLPN